MREVVRSNQWLLGRFGSRDSYLFESKRVMFFNEAQERNGFRIFDGQSREIYMGYTWI